jgi:two-component system sensor histidine kinase KdpD
MAQRELIFQPFQRLGDVSSGSGVGLGLAVARGFVEAVGGEISVEDTPGGGLTMVLSLPAEVEQSWLCLPERPAHVDKASVVEPVGGQG